MLKWIIIVIGFIAISVIISFKWAVIIGLIIFSLFSINDMNKKNEDDFDKDMKG